MTPTVCRGCGSRLQSGARFCQECGREVQTDDATGGGPDRPTSDGDATTGGVTDAASDARASATDRSPPGSSDSTVSTPSTTAGDDPSPSGTSEQAASHPSHARTVYCHSCGEQILEAAELCPHCGVRQRDSSTEVEKDPVVAVVLSFFLAGAGQVYNGQVGKGVVLIVAEIFLLTIIFITIWFVIGLFFVPIWLLVWGYAMWDAYDKAEKINRGELQV